VLELFSPATFKAFKGVAVAGISFVIFYFLIFNDFLFGYDTYFFQSLFNAHRAKETWMRR